MEDSNKLLELAFDFWSEALEEHTAGRPAECGACWKSYMASELWRHVTRIEVPVNYRQEHQAAAFKASNVLSLGVRKAA